MKKLKHNLCSKNIFSESEPNRHQTQRTEENTQQNEASQLRENYIYVQFIQIIYIFVSILGSKVM